MSMVSSGADARFEQQYKEWYSRAFVQAVTASAGVSAEWSLDDVFYIDVVFRQGGVSADVQLKATSVPEYTSDGSLAFDLEVDAYNELISDRLAPAYLIVVVIGPTRPAWVEVALDRTKLSHHARWLRLTGMTPSLNSATQRVHLPESNVLTATAVGGFMTAAREEWR